MISLANKYRPKKFEELTEQSIIADVLTNQVKNNTFKHAYLFTGPAGVGKTTSARIFANMLNDNNEDAINIEIDAASNNGVDNIRNIIEDSKQKPLLGKYKIYIIDEVHGLSNSSWESLLKLLEEPPATAIFIMCTTDAQKVPNTILSRAQSFRFTKISNEGIKKRLIEILDTENIKYDEEVIEHIVKLSDGGMRDAITSVDECLSLNGELTSLDDVLSILGVEDYKIQFELLNLLLNKNKQCISIIEDVYNSGKDVKHFIKDFIKFLLDVQKYTIFNSFKFINIPKSYEEQLQGLDNTALYRITNLMVNLNNDLKWDNDPRTLLELSLILYCDK